MPTVTVRLGKSTPLDSGAFARKLEASIKSSGLDRKIAERVLAKQQEKVNKVSAGYYNGMLRSVGDTLRSPPFRANTEDWAHYSTTVPVTIGSGVPGVPESEAMVLESGRGKAGFEWKRLSKKYAKSREEWEGLPESTHFWKKTGELSALYDSAILAGGGSYANPGRYSVDMSKSALPHGAWGYRVAVSVRPPSLPEPLQSLLRQAFLTGKPVTYREVQLRFLFMPGGPHDISRFAYPEYVRPMFSLFAARTGRKYTAALSQALR